MIHSLCRLVKGLRLSAGHCAPLCFTPAKYSDLHLAIAPSAVLTASTKRQLYLCGVAPSLCANTNYFSLGRGRKDLCGMLDVRSFPPPRLIHGAFGLIFPAPAMAAAVSEDR